MLKSDLIAILVQKRGITQKQAESTVETIFECMKDALCKGENIEIRGLGAFHVKNYDGYQGRNPKTGQVIPVRPKRGILFRTGKELRDRVNRAAAQHFAEVAAAEAAASAAVNGEPAAAVASIATVPAPAPVEPVAAPADTAQPVDETAKQGGPTGSAQTA